MLCACVVVTKKQRKCEENLRRRLSKNKKINSTKKFKSEIHLERNKFNFKTIIHHITMKKIILSRDITLTRGNPRPEKAAINYLTSFISDSNHQSRTILPWALSHLRWMAQKDDLAQDMLLVGPPGALRRRLAMAYCELAGREVEIVTLTQDTTESDLKQRREIVNKSALFVDQAPVRAAIEGRVLILDGLDKAERNVLPTLNNLLENREMALSDGRFLTDRADAVNASVDGSLVQVHPDFRVIALGVPVPRFAGFPLDPPLRSRFQVRSIGKIFPEQRTFAMTSKHSSNSDFNSTDLALIKRSVQLDVTLESLGCGGGGTTVSASSSGANQSSHASESLPLAGHKVLYFPLEAR